MNIDQPSTWAGLPGLLLFFAVTLAGCGESPRTETQRPQSDSRGSDRVTVVSYPLYEALRSVVGDPLDLFHPEVPAGQAMDREMARRVQASRLVIVDGTHQVGWVDTVTLPESRKRLSTFDILDRLIRVDNLGSHSHGPGGQHSHQGIVAQTWLDPSLFREQLRTVLRACVAADLLPADRVELALADWVSRTRPLEQKLEELAALPPRKVMANRAGTEYLFRRLGWPVEIQELERLFTEDPGQLERELAQRRTADPSWVAVFADPPPPPLLALLEKLAIPTIMLDLIDQSGPQNYPDRLGENLKNIEKVALIPF